MNESTATSFFSSEEFRIEPKLTIKCNDSELFTSQWKIYNGQNFDQLLTPSFNLTKTILKVSKHSLGYGMIKACLTVAMNIEPIFKTTECGYVLINGTPLIASLVGGDEIVAPKESNVSIAVFLRSISFAHCPYAQMEIGILKCHQSH